MERGYLNYPGVTFRYGVPNATRDGGVSEGEIWNVDICVNDLVILHWRSQAFECICISHIESSSNHVHCQCIWIISIICFVSFLMFSGLCMHSNVFNLPQEIWSYREFVARLCLFPSFSILFHCLQQYQVGQTEEESTSIKRQTPQQMPLLKETS